MPDLSSITAIVKSVKTATEIAKFIKDSDLTIEKAEIKLQLAELISSLADARIETAEIQSLIIEKDKKIDDLIEKLQLQGKLKYEAPYYWLIEEKTKDGPFCQRCYEKNNENILIRLIEPGEKGYWECKVCKNHYTDSNYSPSMPGVIHSTRNWDGY